MQQMSVFLRIFGKTPFRKYGIKIIKYYEIYVAAI
jgi:hypothetical protein